MKVRGREASPNKFAIIKTRDRLLAHALTI